MINIRATFIAVMRGKYRYYCEEYPEYTFVAIPPISSSKFRVTYERGLDSTLMVDLIVGETITLTPFSGSVMQDEKEQNNLIGKKRKFDEYSSNIRNNHHDSIKVYAKEDTTLLCKIMTIDQSANGRRSDIVVERA
jgi:hypothetical protein